MSVQKKLKVLTPFLIGDSPPPDRPPEPGKTQVVHLRASRVQPPGDDDEIFERTLKVKNRTPYEEAAEIAAAELAAAPASAPESRSGLRARVRALELQLGEILDYIEFCACRK